MHQILVTLGEGWELESRDCYQAFRGFLIEGESPGRPGKTGWKVERVEGIEPSPIAWEAIVVPFNYTRFSCLDGALKRRVQ